MNNLKLIHIPHNNMAPVAMNKKQFVLTTCQRILILSFDFSPFAALEDVKTYEAQDAYHFLLETICGLKSRLCAEQEITSQFRAAFAHFCSIEDRDTRLQLIIEKLFKDSKEIRTRYLTHVGQNSYAMVAKRIITEKTNDNSVLLLGSGKLAEDILKVFCKRYQISLSARNSERVSELASQYPISVIEWKDHHQYLRFNTIINTIGANQILFDHRFFINWLDEKKTFIDLGSPSIVTPELGIQNGIIRLETIFEKANCLNQHKEELLLTTKVAIENLVATRIDYFRSHAKLRAHT